MALPTKKGRCETILVVVDEPIIREVVRTILESSAYQVLDVGSGSDALALLEQNGPVDLLLTDVLMPELNGIELAREAKRLRPALPILFISGYWERFEHSRDEFECVPKPFGPVELLNKVREILNGVSGGKDKGRGLTNDKLAGLKS